MRLSSLVFSTTLFLVFQSAEVFSQTGKFTDDFATNKGWKFSNEIDADSAEIVFGNGSMTVSNKHVSNRRLIIEYTPTSSALDLRNDMEWDCTVRFKHLSGPRNKEFGICIGSSPGKQTEDGLNIGISGNGYYKLSSFSNKRMQEIKPWTQYSLLKTNAGESNELRIICRPYSNLYLLVNEGWAYMGKKGYTSGNTFYIYVDPGQTIAIDDLSISSFKSVSNKLIKDNIIDFIEVCKKAENNFAFAKGFESQAGFKTWLAPITISNREFLIQPKKGNIFPPNITDTSSKRFIYTIPQYFSDDQLQFLENEKKKLIEVIEGGFKKFTKKEISDAGKKTTWYFNRGDDVPKSIIAWIEEYKDADKNYLVVNIIHAPDIASF